MGRKAQSCDDTTLTGWPRLLAASAPAGVAPVATPHGGKVEQASGRGRPGDFPRGSSAVRGAGAAARRRARRAGRAAGAGGRRPPAALPADPLLLAGRGLGGRSVRAPIGQLRLLTSSTPIGWTLLLRAVPPLGGPERYRLLPLAFGVATVPLAWMLARRLGRWGTVRAAVAAATAALVPASLARHDLKQYSAEGFVAVGVVLLVAWVEEGWSRRRLALLALLGAASILIANIAPLVVLGGLLALVLTAPAPATIRRCGAGGCRTTSIWTMAWARRRASSATVWSRCSPPWAWGRGGWCWRWSPSASGRWPAPAAPPRRCCCRCSRSSW